MAAESLGPRSQANYVLAFPAPSPAFLGADNVSFDPRFLAPDDLRLGPDSPALDFAPSTSSDPLFDLDTRPRQVDLPLRINRHGAQDLGAFERQLGDPLTGSLFANGFERQ